MYKFFNCLTIVFATIMFVSCNGKETAKEAKEKVVIESEKDSAKKEGCKTIINKDGSIMYMYDSATYYNRFRDTIDVETCLSGMEEVIVELKELHVKSLADTVVIEDKLSELFDFVDDSTYVDMDSDHLLHSQKVRYYQAILSYFDECLRLEEELVSVGYPKAKTIEEDKDGERLLKMRDMFQEALNRELN